MVEKIYSRAGELALDLASVQRRGEEDKRAMARTEDMGSNDGCPDDDKEADKTKNRTPKKKKKKPKKKGKR